MNCLKNIEYNKIANDIIKRYLDLYTFIGRNREFMKAFEEDFTTLTRQTIQQDAYFMGQLLDLNITETRYRQLITKDVKAKTNDEQRLKNIKEAFLRIHDDTDSFELIDREIHDLLKFLHKDAASDHELAFAKENSRPEKKINLLSSGHKTKREALSMLVERYHYAKRHHDYEDGFINLCFYIDLTQLKPFKKHNDTIALIMLYVLLLSDGYLCFHLSSFFEKLMKRKDVFMKLKNEAVANWTEGLADVHDLHRFILDVAIEAYKEVHEMLRNYTFDKELNKGDYIENTINRLNEVFSKEDIRNAHPTISESTINRTLARLRDEKKIRPLGKGRSAKWMKLYESPKKRSLQEQLNLKI